VLYCIWPQQVCASGKSTSTPSRSSTRTVAIPVLGKATSLTQVTNRAMRIATRIIGGLRFHLRCYCPFPPLIQCEPLSVPGCYEMDCVVGRIRLTAVIGIMSHVPYWMRWPVVGAWMTRPFPTYMATCEPAR